MYAVGDQVNSADGDAVAATTAADGTAGAGPGAATTARRWLPGWAVDLAALASYAALAVAVLSRLWTDPAGRVLRSNEDDHGIFLFLLAHGERVVFHGQDPFFSLRLNLPDGVNMMANTSILALSLPMAPITHFAGPAVSVVLLLTVGLAGTAAAWYWVLSRQLVRHRTAAYLAGLWCGFAPAMVSHANGHVNFVANFVVPFIVWRVLRLREPGRAVRNGLVLAALIVVQVFINEEVLLFTAMATGSFVIGYAVLRRQRAAQLARPFLTGLGVAAAASTVLLAYPLWFQFFGPRHYRGLPFEPGDFVSDLLSYPAFARLSVAGDPAVTERLSGSPTEDNSFFGWPLLLVLLLGLVLCWRVAAVRVLSMVGLLFLVMSLGPALVVDGRRTGIPMPFALISDVPVLDLISVTRFAMVVTVVVGVLLALLTDRIMAGRITVGDATRWARPLRVAYPVLLVLALLPVAPRPLPAADAAPLPAFLADGLWRPYVPPGRTLVPVPLPDVTTGREGMRWVALSRLEFAAPRGYFMGPADPPRDDTGAWSAAPRPTAELLTAVAAGRPVTVDAAARRAAVLDLRFWRAAVLVQRQADGDGPLRAAVTDLVGRAPQPIGGVWMWDVRDLAAGPGD